MAITLYATNNFTGNGTTTNWNINFADGYISTADVKARYVDSNGDYQDITVTNVAGNVVTISPAQPSGRVFQIYRDTQKSSPLVDFADGAILNEANLDTMATQSVMVAAEASDLALSLSVVAYDAINLATDASADATAAQASAAAAQTSAANAQTAATAAQTAASNAAASASTANANASAAQSAANNAVTTANGAASTAAAAQSAATTATSTANSALTNSSTAITTANAASTTASNALTTANNASSAATNAVNTANAAASTANGIDAKATQALNNSNTAVTTANNASSAATTAVSTANNALSVANGIDAKAEQALDDSAAAVATANAAAATANGIDAKAQQALDDSADAVATANSAASDASTALSAVSGKADLASPTFTGDPKAPTPTAGDNDTSIATTAFVQTALASLTSGYRRQFISSSTVTNFVVPAGVTQLTVTAIGGGGGGGGGGGTKTGATFGSQGGLAGRPGRMMKQTITVTPGETLTITCGQGGSGGSGANPVTLGKGSNGTNGGTTTVNRGGTILVQADFGFGAEGGHGTLNGDSKTTLPAISNPYSMQPIICDSPVGSGINGTCGSYAVITPLAIYASDWTEASSNGSGGFVNTGTIPQNGSNGTFGQGGGGGGGCSSGAQRTGGTGGTGGRGAVLLEWGI